MKQIPGTICYFGICDMAYSRNKVFSSSLKLQGWRVHECITKKAGIRKYFDLYKKHRLFKNKYDVLIVGFPGFVIAPFARVITTKPVVLDALSSRYDSDIVSRNAHSGNKFKKWKILLTDWFAFVCSQLILVESRKQKEFIAKKFKIPLRKIAVAYTGVDEDVFVKKNELKKNDTFTVLFRGRIMNEAGVPAILRAALLLKDDDIHFDIIGYGWGPWIEAARDIYTKLSHEKVKWDEKEIPIGELVVRMQQAHISLGQFGDNERLDRTIPHKAFESMILGIPYLTKKSGGVSEVMEDGVDCMMVNESKPESIANAIRQLRDNSEYRNKLRKNAEQKYYSKYSWNEIGKRLVVDIRRLIDKT